MNRKRKSDTQGIHPPQLPTQHTPLGVEQVREQATLAQIMVVDGDLSAQETEDLLVEQVHFKRVRLPNTHFPLAQLSDVRFDTCDLAAAEWEKAHLNRVEYLGCRMIGAKLIDGKIEHTLFGDCNMELALFWNASFASVRFERCVLRNASFEGANLAGVAFRGCDLSQADLRGARLVGTDFRGSAIEGLRVGIKELQGAIIDPTQAVHLANLLGMTVREDEVV